MASDTRGEIRASESGPFDWLDRSLATVVVGSLVATFVAGIVQLRFGTYPMALGEVWATVFDPSIVFDPQVWNAFLLGGDLPQMSKQSLVVWNIRLPRIIVAALVGTNLAISGAIFQAITRNELASPYVLGVSSGAGLAVLITLVLFSGLAAFLPVFALLGGAVAFLLVYAIAWKGGTSPVRLVLAGVIVSTIFWSLQRGLFYLADDLGVVQSAIAWTTGSLTGVDWAQVRIALPWTLLSVGLALAGARQLNVLLLGERTAKSLGMSVETVRFALAGVAVLAASAAISVAGVVSFVGLVVPHMVRTVVGTDYKRLMVGCIFAGPALVVVADVGARLALNPTQVPVGVVTGLVGGPYFLYLMRQQREMGKL
jgi:iron complex transport system permease protein